MFAAITAAPAAIKGAASMHAAGLTGMVVAQTAPSVDVLQYGATGVVSISFLYMMYALGNGKIVSKSTDTTEARMLELATKATEREAAALKREEELSASLDRLFQVLTKG